MRLITLVLVHLFIPVKTRCSNSNEVITFNNFCPTSTTYVIGSPKTSSVTYGYTFTSNGNECEDKDIYFGLAIITGS